MAAYARQAKDSELIQYATEIKVRAERRCGELLRGNLATASERGERGADSRWGSKSRETTSHPPTLADMGLTRDESSRYQRLAGHARRALRDCHRNREGHGRRSIMAARPS